MNSKLSLTEMKAPLWIAIREPRGSIVPVREPLKKFSKSFSIPLET